MTKLTGTVLVILIAAPACFVDEGPHPCGSSGSGPSSGSDSGSDSGSGTGLEGSSSSGLCEGVGGVGADDPCCAVHQCLLAAGEQACEQQEACNAMVDPGTVCGDQLCDGVECSECP